MDRRGVAGGVVGRGGAAGGGGTHGVGPRRVVGVAARRLQLLCGRALLRCTAGWGRAFAIPVAVIGAISLALGVIDHERRPLDPYRGAAIALKHQATTKPVVATGYCYLEAVIALNRPVMAWPAEQAQHPGWRATSPPDPRALPSVPFLWFGERFAPELTVLRGVKAVRPLFWNERALIADARDLTSPVH